MAALSNNNKEGVDAQVAAAAADDDVTTRGLKSAQKWPNQSRFRTDSC